MSTESILNQKDGMIIELIFFKRLPAASGL
jgi:hypothetical protein